MYRMYIYGRLKTGSGKGKERRMPIKGREERKGFGGVEVDKVVGKGVHRGRSVR